MPMPQPLLQFTKLNKFFRVRSLACFAGRVASHLQAALCCLCPGRRDAGCCSPQIAHASPCAAAPCRVQEEKRQREGGDAHGHEAAH